MKTYDVWMAHDLSINAFEAVGELDVNSPPSGYDVHVVRLDAMSSLDAVNHYRARVSSGMIRTKAVSVPASLNQSSVSVNPSVQPVIFCDFNGVLDNKNRYSRESDINFKLAQEACAHKVYRLVKFALKYQAEVVFTSEHRKLGASLRVIVARCLHHSKNPLYASFYRNNKRAISACFQDRVTPDTGIRSEEIVQFIEENHIAHCVVFEDDHPICEKLNPIMTDWMKGLQDKHIAMAEYFLAA